MSIKKTINALAFIALAMTTMNVNAADINAVDAQKVANNYLKQHVASGRFNAQANVGLKLVHAEKASDKFGANDFYAFNITGGGFVIVAGEDRATPVLGYSDKGRIDFNNLPAPLKDLLDGYKAEIELLRSYKGNDLVPAPVSYQANGAVEPLITSTWGQEMPYYLQCPVYRGEYCVVGCVATAMAQVMNYWQYPTSISSQARYYCYDIGGYVPALPAATIDYSLMLDSYCHWDWDNSVLVQDTYTDAQAQEVAKLGRYCGQAVEMGYSPEGSGAYTNDQLSAMKSFGFTNSKLYQKSSGWGGWGNDNYTKEQWESMIKTELDAGRPILYSANDPSAGGHAFICDGYNSDGLFHFNLGWYGTCDGWYVSTALNMVHRDGDELHFTSGHEIITNIQPSNYCKVTVESMDANNDLLIVGEDILNMQAVNVTFRTTYFNIYLMFALTDAEGNRVASSDAVGLNNKNFEQGSNVTGTVNLLSDLTPGIYNLSLYYYINDANQLTAVAANATGQLHVVGHLAKYNAPFEISDVTRVIDEILNESHPSLTIGDVSDLIDYILNYE